MVVGATLIVLCLLVGSSMAIVLKLQLLLELLMEFYFWLINHQRLLFLVVFGSSIDMVVGSIVEFVHLVVVVVVIYGASLVVLFGANDGFVLVLIEATMVAVVHLVVGSSIVAVVHVVVGSTMCLVVGSILEVILLFFFE